MKIIQLSDIHGAKYLIREIGEEISSADLVVLAGDVTHFGTVTDAKKIITEVRRFNNTILAVAGNCDHPEIEEYFDETGISLHGKSLEMKEFQFSGLGGSLPCPGATPNENSENKYREWIETMEAGISPNKKLILISHQPPYNTECDKLIDGTHVGSKAIRDFLLHNNIFLCFTGHIHESIGHGMVNSCMVINPGPFRKGRYSVVTVAEDLSVNLEFKQITA